MVNVIKTADVEDTQQRTFRNQIQFFDFISTKQQSISFSSFLMQWGAGLVQLSPQDGGMKLHTMLHLI